MGRRFFSHGVSGFASGLGAALGIDAGDSAGIGASSVGSYRATTGVGGDYGVVSRSAWLLARPSIPLALWLALGLWAGIGLAYPALRGRADVLCLVCLGAALVSAVTLAALAFTGWGCTPLIAFCLGIAVGLACSSSLAVQLSHAQQQLLGYSGATTVELVQDSRQGGFGTTITGRVCERGLSGLVRVNLADDVSLMAGERIRIRVSWREPSSSSAETSWLKGIVATANASSYEAVEARGLGAMLRQVRRSAVSGIERAAPADAPGTQFLEAVLLGWREAMYDSDWYAAAKTDGIAHMVAVSGAHLAIVCGISLAILGRLGVSRKTQWVVQLGLIVSYLVLTGVAVSAVRAAFMTVLSLSSFLVRRRAYSLGALSLAMAVMLSLDPTCAFSLSFILSAGSTLGIVLFARYFERFMTGMAHREHSGAIVQTLALTFAAQLITNPLSASEFCQLSLIAPVANLLISPCFTIVCGLGLPLVLVNAAWAGAALPVAALSQAGSVLCSLMQVLSRVPGAAIPTDLDQRAALFLAVAVPVALWIAWPRPRWRLVGAMALIGAGVAAVLVLGPLSASDQIVMLDVGQGDAFLLRSQGKAMLIDTGNHDKELLQGLARHGVYQLDAVVITHADDDHCGSLSALKGTVPVKKVVVSSEMRGCTEAKVQALLERAQALCGTSEGVVGVEAGSALTFGNFTCHVVGPEHFVDEGGNADSLTLLLEADETADGQTDWRALFCGDAEKDQIAAYEAAGLVGDVDIYKVGHHGSRVAIDDRTASVLHPEICLVSVGAGNRYGHPVSSTLDTLQRAGGRVWRTDEQGDVTCALGATEIRVSAAR